MANDIPFRMEYKPHAIRLYVPLAKVSNDFEHALAALMGGFTVTEAHGTWRMDDGALCREVVRIYYVVARDDERSELALLIQDETQRLLESGEEAVLVEYLRTDSFIFRNL